MLRRSLVVLAVLALIATAGVAMGQPEERTLVEDPDDDARIERFEDIPVLKQLGCQTSQAHTTCSQASPARDITRLAMAETSRELIVRLEVAAFEEDLRGAADEHALSDRDPGEPTDPTARPLTKRHSSFYMVCWAGEEGSCSTGLELWVQRIHGEIVDRSRIWVYGGDCPMIPCQYRIPYTIETGEPGVIEWRIPRALLAEASQGEVIEQPAPVTIRTDDRSHTPAIEPRAAGDVLCPLLIDTECEGGLQPDDTEALDGHDTVDWTDTADNYTFQTPLDPRLPPSFREAGIGDHAGDVPGPDSPDLDILGVALDTQEDAVTIGMRKAQVSEDPLDQTLWMNFGVDQDIPYIHLRADVEAGERTFQALLFDDLESSPEELSVNGTVTPGEPGWVNVTIPASEASLEDRELAWLWAGIYDPRRSDPEPARGALAGQEAVYFSRWQSDTVGPGTAYRFNASHEAGQGGVGQNATVGDEEGSLEERLPDLSTVEVADEDDDAELPADANPRETVLGTVGEAEDDQQLKDAFEITRVRAEAERAEHLKLTVYVNHLESIDVPASYDAVLYGSAVQTEEGRFLLARYETQDGPRGQAAPDLPRWFCSADSMVLTDDDPQIPGQANPIEAGFVRTSQPDPSEEQGGGGTRSEAEIEFLRIPRECLGNAPPGPLDVQEMGAGTFLFRAAEDGDPAEDQAGVQVVDEAEEALNATLEPPEEELAPASQPAPDAGGFTEPFGIDNFWDIAGITGTILASLIGAVLVRRRRTALRDYLEEIDRIVEEHEGDPSGRQAALLELRGEAKDDLVDGRLTEQQYVVVKDRIAEEVNEARLEGIEDAFGELPHRLLEKLKTMVASDGLSPEDRRLFSTMLEDSALTADAKERIRRKLDVWTQAPGPQT